MFNKKMELLMPESKIPPKKGTIIKMPENLDQYQWSETSNHKIKENIINFELFKKYNIIVLTY